jgi:hypothetical protein
MSSSDAVVSLVRETIHRKAAVVRKSYRTCCSFHRKLVVCCSRIGWVLPSPTAEGMRQDR